MTVSPANCFQEYVIGSFSGSKPEPVTVTLDSPIIFLSGPAFALGGKLTVLTTIETSSLSELPEGSVTVSSKTRVSDLVLIVGVKKYTENVAFS